MDITDHRDFVRNIKAVDTQSINVRYPATPVLQARVKPLLKELSTEPMKVNLEKFSSFYNRFYTSKWGKESADWLASKVTEVITEAGADKFGVTMLRFSHQDPKNFNANSKAYGDGSPFNLSQERKRWNQTSIIATIPGRSNKTVVIGAHQDSINNLGDMNQNWGDFKAPGADDDGSGAITILEAMRVLLKDDGIKRGHAPNTIEFHWYSAEEKGLLGSVDVFSKYKKEGRDVRAMLQQDMTGYVKGSLKHGRAESLGVITDHVDRGLTNFIKRVIKDYCDIPYVETQCGYACSDHASAEFFHYPSAFVIESDMRDTADYIHSEKDTVDQISFPHMLQHAKMTLALAYELAYADLPTTNLVML
jgi:leucyl aminopeptidase